MKLFNEDNGNTSSMRVMAVVVVTTGLGIGLTVSLVALLKGTGDIGTNIMGMVLGLVGLGLTGKVIHKGLEK